MIPAPFDYEVAESADHALELLRRARGREAARRRTLAAAAAAAAVDAPVAARRPRAARASSRTFATQATSIAIGALTRHHDVATAPLLQEHNPLVSYAAGLIGDPQVRHRGTIGGSLAHGDPASRSAGGRCSRSTARSTSLGADGVRTVAARDFFRGVFETAAGPQRARDRGARAEAHRRPRLELSRSSAGGRRTGRRSASPRSRGARTAGSSTRRSRSSAWARRRFALGRPRRRGRPARTRGPLRTRERSRRATNGERRIPASPGTRARPARRRGGDRPLRQNAEDGENQVERRR